MLNCGKKFRALRDNFFLILTLVLSEKKILNETKNHNPPLQVKWWVPYAICYFRKLSISFSNRITVKPVLKGNRWDKEIVAL